MNQWIVFLVIGLTLGICWLAWQREGYRQAALTCYWEDPGPPMPIPIRPDPQQVVPQEGPPSSSFTQYLNDPTDRPQIIQRIPPPQKTRTRLVVTPQPSSGTMPPILNSAFVQQSSSETPAPTFGVLAIPPLVSTTPRPTIAAAPIATAAPVTQSPLPPVITRPILSTMTPK